MPLPTGTISLSNVGNVSGSYNMNATNARKLCGINLTSGVSWSLNDARGKSWIISASNTGSAITYRGQVDQALNGYSPGTYQATVRYNQYWNQYWLDSVDYEIDYWHQYSSMVDTGGGFTNLQPWVNIMTQYFTYQDNMYGQSLGNLSGAG